MNCEQCSQNPATYHLTAIENGKKAEKHLCEECAKKAGMGFKFNASIADLLGDKKEKKPGKKDSKTCPNCGMSYSQFRQNGRFGCANDYELFGDEIPKILQNIHGKSQHVGKVPQDAKAKEGEGEMKMRERAQITTEIERLKIKLEDAVKQEAYEKAAALRDEIKKLEANLAALK